MDFAQIPMPESLKIFYNFFFYKKNRGILEILAGFNTNPNRVPLSETFEKVDTQV